MERAWELLREHRHVFVVRRSTLHLHARLQLVQHALQQLVSSDVLKHKNVRVLRNIGHGEAALDDLVLDLVAFGGMANHHDFVGFCIVDLGFLGLLELVGGVPLLHVRFEGVMA